MIDYAFATITFSVSHSFPVPFEVAHRRRFFYFTRSFHCWVIRFVKKYSWHFLLFLISYHLCCQLVKSIWFPWKMRDTPMLMTLSWNRARSKIVQFFIRLCCESFQFLHGACNHFDIYRRAGNFTLKFWWMVCLYLYWIIAQFWRKTISHTFVF